MAVKNNWMKVDSIFLIITMVVIFIVIVFAVLFLIKRVYGG